MNKPLLKIAIGAGVMICAGVYILTASFLALMLHFLPVNVSLGGSDPVDMAQVQLDNSYQQADRISLQGTVSTLGVGVNVQGQ